MIEEILKLTRENNEMFKQISNYITNLQNNQLTEDAKNLMINMIANYLIRR